MRKLCITLGLVLASFISYAQTDDVNLQKYWKLRGDLRENFLKIGSEEGNSIVARAQQPLRCVDNDPANNPAIGAPFNYGTIHWGDGMIRHGYYLGLLATEYRLLKDAGEDVSGVLNELYYALKTINRLDLNAEEKIGEIYGYTLSQNLNGFYLREDIPEGFADDNWSNSKIEARCDDSPHYYNGDALHLDESPNSNQNTPSTDQISALMLGFALINKLVDDEFVQPTSSDVGFNIKTEMKAIATRMVTYLRNHNWFYIDVQGWPVNNGGDDFIYASPAIEQFISDLNGTPYINSTIRRNKTMYKNSKRVKRDQYCLTGKEVAGSGSSSQSDACNDVLNWIIIQPVYLPIHNSLTDNYGLGYPENNESNSAFQVLHLNGLGIASPPLTMTTTDLNSIWLGAQLMIEDGSDDGEFDILGGTETFLNWFSKDEINFGDPDNYLLLMNIGVASKIYGVNDANYFANLSGNYQLELIAAVLKDQTPNHSQSFFKSFLDNMTPIGPYNLYFNSISSSPIGQIGVFSEIAQQNGWASYDRWTNQESINGGTNKHQGIFNGLDYLLFHNLYRLKYKSSLGNVSLNETCFCETLPETPIPYTGLPYSAEPDIQNWVNGNMSKMITKLPNCTKDYFGTNFSIPNTREVTPYFSYYSDINVFTPQYLTSSLNLENAGILNIKTRYILCGSSILTMNTGSKMNIKKAGVFARSNSKIYTNGEIVVEAGATLKISDNAALRLYDGSKLIIKDGGTVDFNGAEFLHFPGAKIYMEGPNSKLILHKDIKLMGTQDFEIVQLGTEHGQIIIDGPDVKLLSTSATSTFKLIGKNKTQPLLILTNNSKLTQDNAQGKSLRIAYGAVVFGENTKIDEKQTFYADNIHALSTVPNLGLFTQELTVLNNSDFTNVQVTANLNIENIGSLQVTGSVFTQANSLPAFSGSLIKVVGRGYTLENCTLSSKRLYGIESSSLTLASSIITSTISSPFVGAAINTYKGVQDVSNIELVINKSSIFQTFQGVRKLGGKLSVRCSDFKDNKDCNITLEDNCLLNMSSNSNAGYNSLRKSIFDNNIILRNVPVPVLVNGYNFIEACLTSNRTIKGLLNTTCTTCPHLDFTKNHWNATLTSPGIITSLTSSNGTTYTASISPMALTPASCPPLVIGPGPKSLNKLKSTNQQTLSVYSSTLNDTILIEDLLAISSGKISLLVDDSSNNLEAILLLNDLFSSSVSKSDSLTNFYLNFGLDLMKMAVEESFRKEELSQIDNISSFDPYVAKYVDALVYMSDSIIDSSNYEMQYVLEIDKAHLMRLTGHPEIGLNILTELENCGLDSIAQANLNFWKQEYETDIIIKQIGQQYLDTTISIDTSAYFNPVLAVNNYSFGSIINDVNDIQYTNCDFFNTKELMTGKLENQIAVYPNPSTTLFDIAIKSPVEGLCSFKIVQMDGKTICERQFEMSFNHNEKVESINWPSGVYTLIVTLPNKEQKRIKVLVQ